MSVGLATARALIAAALAAAGERDLKPMTVVVLDGGGHLVAAERQDGASFGRFDIAVGKAYGALALGLGSRALMNRAEQQAYFVDAARAAIGGRLVPVPGGVLIRQADVVIGAVGISGDTSDNDEAIAVAAIRAVELSPDTG